MLLWPEGATIKLDRRFTLARIDQCAGHKTQGLEGFAIPVKRELIFGATLQELDSEGRKTPQRHSPQLFDADRLRDVVPPVELALHSETS